MVREGTIVELNKVDEQLAHPAPQDKVLELRDIRRALAELPRGQREAVVMICLDGWSYERVVKAAGLTVGPVRSRLSRGRERLRMVA
jgi:RNA polymerase sigma-70 factor (ECF subfamily)